MKKVFNLIAFFFLVAAFKSSMPYQPVDEGSSVKFKIKNLGITVDGSFKGLNGTIEFDPAKPNESIFNVTIDANTINTGINSRDNHLRKEEYFNIASYPLIKLVATRVTPSTVANTFMLYGNLTIKNVTKAISIPFTATPQSNGLLFKGEFKMNRRDFSVGGNSFTLSDNLTMYLNVFAKKK